MKNLIKKIYAFNLYNRDVWVQEISKTVENNSTVLDIGAGSAPYRNLFSHCQYKTQDFSQLDAQQLRGSNGYFEIDYVCDITNIPVADNSFDYILCTEVLEHVPYPIKAIEEISRILKPGGKLFLTAPLGSGLHQEPYHFYGGYTPYWYDKFLSDNNLVVESIQSNNGFYSYFAQEMIRFLLRGLRINSVKKILLIPFSLFFLLPALLLPIFAPFFDKFDQKKDFTIGYHIIAYKL